MSDPSVHPATRETPSVGESAVPVTKLVATTRREEARAALAVTAALTDHGVSPSDILLVARSLSQYETPFRRAARRHDLTLSFWTQLHLRRTRPYQLVDTLCTLFATPEPTPTQLFAPLTYDWPHPTQAPTDTSPVATDGDTAWPIPQPVVAAARRSVADEPAQPLSDWCATLAAADDVPPRVQAFVEWAADQPTAPTPADVTAVLQPVIDTYHAVVLPQREAAVPPPNSTPEADAELNEEGLPTESVAELETLVRAADRVASLVAEVQATYAEWRQRDRTARSWATVQDLQTRIAAERPGSRSHKNAAVVDVLEANDVWFRSVPYVIAVGLVDGVWPRSPTGQFPVALRDRIIAEENAAMAALALHSGWHEAPERDQFQDTVRAATRHLVLTRYQQDHEGVPADPSPYYQAIGETPEAESAVTALLSSDRTLPPALAKTCCASTESTDTDTNTDTETDTP